METYRDIRITCEGCGAPFLWTAEQQRVARLRDWWPKGRGDRQRPKNCADCREALKRLHQSAAPVSGAARTLVCASCGATWTYEGALPEAELFCARCKRVTHRPMRTWKRGRR